MNQRSKFEFTRSLLAATLLLVAASVPAAAAPDGGPPGARRPGAQRPPATRWLDNAHSHSRYYPTTGLRTHALPGRAPPLVWGGANYWFWSGVWYAPSAGGYLVVRPPYGIVVGDLPSFRTAVVIGGLTYLYLNGVYYRERAEGDYEVVPSPVAGTGTPSGAPGRIYVYPALGQSAETQASDEYECHRWAASQSGFDPTPAATGQGTDVTRRTDYVRAQTACLEGRGYTVK
ncbi:MAG: DUF6515 family protein [Rubrivivax sp.]|nr:DUF6515 family protein [Rubrivivax sp.]